MSFIPTVSFHSCVSGCVNMLKNISFPRVPRHFELASLKICELKMLNLLGILSLGRTFLCQALLISFRFCRPLLVHSFQSFHPLCPFSVTRFCSGTLLRLSFPLLYTPFCHPTMHRTSWTNRLKHHRMRGCLPSDFFP